MFSSRKKVDADEGSAEQAATSSPAASAVEEQYGFVEMSPEQQRAERQKEAVQSYMNRFNRVMDITCGLGCMSFNALMVMSRQGSWFANIGMWTAGSYLFAESEIRRAQGPSLQVATTEMGCAWLWMLSSFGRFKETGMLKWPGISSLAGLVAASYYSTLYLYEQYVAEEVPDAEDPNANVYVKRTPDGEVNPPPATKALTATRKMDE